MDHYYNLQNMRVIAYYTTVPEREYGKIYSGTALDCVAFSCNQFYGNVKDRFVDIGLITIL